MTADNYHDQYGVLLNLLGITDAAELSAYDLLASDLYAATALAYAERQPKLAMDELSTIHAIMFAEIYPWAGKPRTVPLFKRDTQFAEPARIPGFVDRLMPQFQQAAAANPADLSRFLSELWGRLNWLHPFPEGNGRTTQIFITAVARQHGRDIDWSAITRAAELDAARASVKQDFQPYRLLLLRALHDRAPTDTPTVHFPTRTDGR